jgi:uncharacterized protein YcgI (DUF1989 family)
MPHTRAATLHLRPKLNDTLVSNMREPLLTLVEDTSPGIHDTLIAACDPARYKGLGVDKWEEHGSCAENLVLALKELNERAGLKGAKGVGADVTINSVPAPLNLFMNIPWTDAGDVSFDAPKGKANDYVRLKAERDVVVVMSSCPQDILDINGKKPSDAHFIVEAPDEPKPAAKTAVRRRPPPRKVQSSTATSVAGTEKGDTDAQASTTPQKKPVPQRRAVPQRKPSAAPSTQPAESTSTTPQKKASVSGNADGPNGTAPPKEKKKPRKLSTRPKAEAQNGTPKG